MKKESKIARLAACHNDREIKMVHEIEILESKLDELQSDLRYICECWRDNYHPNAEVYRKHLDPNHLYPKPFPK